MQENIPANNLEVTAHQSEVITNPNRNLTDSPTPETDSPIPETDSPIPETNRATPHPAEMPNNLYTSIELQPCPAYGSNELIHQQSGYSEVAYDSIHEYDFINSSINANRDDWM